MNLEADKGLKIQQVHKPQLGGVVTGNAQESTVVKGIISGKYRI